MPVPIAGMVNLSELSVITNSQLRHACHSFAPLPCSMWPAPSLDPVLRRAPGFWIVLVLCFMISKQLQISSSEYILEVSFKRNKLNHGKTEAELEVGFEIVAGRLKVNEVKAEPELDVTWWESWMICLKLASAGRNRPACSLEEMMEDQG